MIQEGNFFNKLFNETYVNAKSSVAVKVIVRMILVALAMLVAALCMLLIEWHFMVFIFLNCTPEWIFTYRLLGFAFLALNCLILFLEGVLLSGVSSTIMEFFSDDPMRFLKITLGGSLHN